MASNSKRSWQIQEFVAHEANVNCLALGQKSGRVLVTGGDDKKVNLWAIGQQNCIMSLSGHLTAVECVKFDHVEEKVCAGSRAGALKLWDLDAAKLFRTLAGHKSGIRCVDFHPYGNFFGSGSLDTSIKLWDYRQRECVFTYEGHRETVNGIKFSPDGQWIASGGAEGDVKIWDLRAGRMLNEFAGHSGAVTDVQFHPEEFLLASGSADRSVSFWDLESFQLVSRTETDTAAIRCLRFDVDGKCLFGGCAQQLTVDGWEPARVFDTVSTGWGKVRDMASSARHQLIGAAFDLTRVLVCVVDIDAVACEAAGGASSSSHGVSPPFGHGQTVRKSFSKRTARPSRTTVEVKPIDEEFDVDEGAFDSAPHANDYEVAFVPHRSLDRSPPPPAPPEPERVPQTSTSFERIRQPTSAEDELSASSIAVDGGSSSSKRTARSHENAAEPSQIPVLVVQQQRPKLPERRILKQTQNVPQPSPSHFCAASQQVTSVCDGPRSSTTSGASKVTHPGKSDNDSSASIGECRVTGDQSSSSSSSPLPDVVSRHRRRSTSENLRPRTLPRSSANDSSFSAKSTVPYVGRENETIPATSNTSRELRLEEFLPASYRDGRSKSRQNYPSLSENEIIASLTRNHEMVLTIMKIRRRNLEIIYSQWHNRDLKCALEGAVSMNDQAVLVDVLTAINKRPSLWSLDVCVVLLPAIRALLHSKYEMYMEVCCESLQLILKNFSALIKTNVQWSSSAIGTDISKEERYRKCVKCYDNLISIRTFLLKRQTMQGKLGQSFRELQSMLYAIEK